MKSAKNNIKSKVTMEVSRNFSNKVIKIRVELEEVHRKYEHSVEVLMNIVFLILAMLAVTTYCLS